MTRTTDRITACRSGLGRDWDVRFPARRIAAKAAPTGAPA